ncbi:MAG: hypothetical protein ACYCVL_01505 [Gemmatimonadaceae bacterium]
MTNEDDRQAVLQRDEQAFWEELQNHKFQYFGCLGTKKRREYSPTPEITRNYSDNYLTTLNDLGVKHIRERSGKPRVRAHYKTCTAQELYAQHMPRFLRQVAKANQGPVSYIYAVEQGTHLERPHIHFELGGVAKVSLSTLQNIWKNMNGGRSDIVDFDSARDTGYTYKCIIAKQASASGTDYEVLWNTNLWKPGRTHNSPEQAALFRKHSTRAA